MKWREFITLLSGASTWPLAARAQQGEQTRRIGVLMNFGADDPDSPALVGAFSQGLAEAGWLIGRNARIDYRWYQGNAEAARADAAELLALTPDIILASGTQGATALKQLTRTVPIVFTRVGDPVGVGIVDSLARPGGNITGFMAYDFSFSGKWLDLLKEIAPHMSVAVLTNTLAPKQLQFLHEVAPTATLVGFLANPKNPAAESDVREVKSAATTTGQQILTVNASDDGEFDTAFTDLVQQHAGALLVMSDPFLLSRPDKIVALAARHALPAMYQFREFPIAGGLMSYGTSLTDGWRQIGIYGGKILKGAKPADLPVQQSVKIELVVNLKTAKTLGITFPESILQRADKVIE
jgi:putative ABC transport system substrate-binding protein